MMIVDERMRAYINSLDKGNTPFLEELEKEARRNFVPIIRREMQSFLKLLLAMKRPESILEIGTGVGFSALLMHEYNPLPCKITTIENYEKRIPIARKNFEKAGKEGEITLLEGDALKVLDGLSGSFDLVFMDAAKGQYLNFLHKIRRLMLPGTILVTDNVFQDGDIIESRFAVERRNRTIHKRMRAYLYELTHAKDLTTSLIPLGDGVAVSIFKEVTINEK